MTTVTTPMTMTTILSLAMQATDLRLEYVSQSKAARGTSHFNINKYIIIHSNQHTLQHASPHPVSYQSILCPSQRQAYPAFVLLQFSYFCHFLCCCCCCFACLSNIISLQRISQHFLAYITSNCFLFVSYQYSFVLCLFSHILLTSPTMVYKNLVGLSCPNRGSP